MNSPTNIKLGDALEVSCTFLNIDLEWIDFQATATFDSFKQQTEADGTISQYLVLHDGQFTFRYNLHKNGHNAVIERKSFSGKDENFTLDLILNPTITRLAD